MKRKLYWLVALAIYSYVSFRLLWRFAPPDGGDGYGSLMSPGLGLPGFHPPRVGELAYHENITIRLQYYLPYVVSALLFAMLGGVVPGALAARNRALAAHPFLGSLVIGFALLLVLPLLLDAGTRAHLWHVPVWLPANDWSIRLLLVMYLPLALLNGLIALGARWRRLS